MNANAQNMNETFRTWNRQWTDAALSAVKAHEQFITSMAGAMSKPVVCDAMPAAARQAAGQMGEFASRQMLEGEKFFANMMRDGIDHARNLFDEQSGAAPAFDAQKSRQSVDQFMQESVRTASDVVNREMAFVNERLNDAAEFGRSMLNCDAVCNGTGHATGNGTGNGTSHGTGEEAKKTARAKA